MKKGNKKEQTIPKSSDKADISWALKPNKGT